MTSLSHKDIKMYTILLVFLSISMIAVSPVAQSATTPNNLETIHDLNSLSLELSVAQNSIGAPLNGMPDDNTNGTVTYNVTVTAENSKDVYPYIYPVRINYSVPDRSGYKKTETIYLTPTRSDGYIPDPAPDTDVEERNLEKKFQITVPYPGVTDDSIIKKSLEVEARSRFTPDIVNGQIEADVHGPIPAGVDGGFVENRAGLNEPSSTTFVDTYRISPSTESSTFQESTNLPSPTAGRLTGSMKSFPSMKQPSDGAATISGSSSGLRFVTLTKNLETGDSKSSPVLQTLAITYSIETGDSDITINPLTPGGQEINEDIDYTLPKDPADSDKCRSLGASDDGNLCIITLDQEETKASNRLGEILLQYEASSSTTAAIYCQSVISGYMTSGSIACGVNKSVKGPEIITIEKFDGYHPPGESPPEYTDDRETVKSTDIPDDGETDLNVRLDPKVTLAEEVSSVDVRWEIYDMDNMAIDGNMKSSSPKFSGTLDAKSDVQIERTDSNVKYSSLDKRYKAVLCPTDPDGDTCSQENKYDSEIMEFVRDSSGNPVLVTRDITKILDTDPTTTSTQAIGEERLETTDPSYGGGEWTCVRGDGCGRESRDKQFTGDIKQEVTVESISGDKADKVDSGGVINAAKDKRSNIVGGSWLESQRTQSLINPRVQISYGTDTPDGDGWEKVSSSSERAAQTGTDRKYFSIQRGLGFSSVVESENKWYPLRGSDANPSSAPPNPGLSENVTKYEDPDNCLNCLTAETKAEAKNRLSRTPSVSLAQTQVGDIWVNPSDGTPVQENTLREDYSPSDIIESERARTKIFENITSEDTGDLLYRRTIFENRVGNSKGYRVPIKKWVSKPGVPKVQFERPVTEPVYKYKRTVYDARYTFRGDITTPSELYEYSKIVSEKAQGYKEDVEWFDISESYTEDQSDLTHFYFKGDGADADIGYRVEWSEEVHEDVEPTEHTSGKRNNLTEYCDELGSGAEYKDLVEKEIGEKFHGEGGRVVIDTCPSAGGNANADKVVRIGKYYDEPREGTYKEEFHLHSGTAFDDRPFYEVDVQGKDDVADETVPEPENPTPEPSDPYIFNLNPINEKVDYRNGIVAIEGYVGSKTEQLPGDGSYRLTVEPADDIDTIGECSELSGYKENITYQVQDQNPSGDTIRQVVQCDLNEFYKYDSVPEEFVHYTVESTDGGELVKYKDLDKGAIQKCLEPLTKEGEGSSATCVSPSGNTVKFGGKYDPNPSSLDDLRSVPGDKLKECPSGYESTEKDITPDDQSNKITQVKCVLSSDPQFELKSRQITVRYEDVRAGVIKKCNNIPTTNEDSSNPHAGYIGSTNSEGNIECQLQDLSDPGPDSFVIRNPDASDANDEYNAIPAGAARGNTTSYENLPSECDSVTEKDKNNALKCDYTGGSGDSELVRYGSKIYGDWLSTSSTVARIDQQGDARKTVWKGGFILDTSGEKFTTTINPRATSYNLETPGTLEANFDFTLRDPSGDRIETDSVDVTLCRAKTLSNPSSLPLENYAGCENFDTLIDGTNDLVNNPTRDSNNLNDIQDAVQNVPSSGVNDYTIHTMSNDACPYNRKYPRQNGQLRGAISNDKIQIKLEAGDSRSDIKQKVRQKIQSRYALQGKLCKDDYNKTKVPSKDAGDGLTFSRPTFSETVSSNTQTKKRSLTSASVYDLQLHTTEPSQTSDDWINGNLRLGTPVIGDISAQDNKDKLELVSHYPFDHDPTEDSVVSTGRSTITPNHYVVQDVYHEVLQNVNTEVEASGTSVGNIYPNTDTPSIEATRRSNHVYQARIWYGSPCNTGDDYGNQRKSHPQSLDGINQDKATTSCGMTTYEDSSSSVLTSAPLMDRNTVIGNDVLTDTDYSVGKNTKESSLDNQAAFLYAPPAEGVPSSISNGNSEPYDATDYLRQNYDDSGLFDSKSLRLNSNSWLMLSPPCMDKRKFDEASGLSDIELAKDSLYNGNCVSGSDVFRGGYADSYETNPISSTDGYETIYDNITSGDDNSYTVSFWVKEGSRNPNNNYDSIDPTSIKQYDSSGSGLPPNNEVFHPFNTLYSASMPAHGIRQGNGNTVENTNDQGVGNKNLQSTARLSIMRTPRSIDVSDIETSGISRLDEQQNVYPKDGWSYKTDTNLRSRFENCILWSSTNDNGDRPVSCDIWYETSDILNGRNPDIVAPSISEDGGLATLESMRNRPDREPSVVTPLVATDAYVVDKSDDYTYNELYADFSKNVFERVNWQWAYDYPVSAHSVRKTQDYTVQAGEYAGIDESLNNFPTSYRGHTGLSCPTGQASKDEDGNGFNGDSTLESSSFIYHGNNCYEDSTYLFKSDTGFPKNRSPTPRHYGNSEWTHVTLSYADKSSDATSRRRGGLTVYINGEKKSSSIPSSITDCTEPNTPEDSSCRKNGESSGNDIEFDGSGIDTGKLYEDSVISIGAQYQHAGYANDLDSEEDIGRTGGKYIPMIRGSHGDIHIDDLRIYKGNVTAAHDEATIGPSPTSTSNTLVQEQIPNYRPIQFPNGDFSSKNYYQGELETSIQRKGDISSDTVTDKFNGQTSVKVSTDAEGTGYVEVDVIPCQGNTCYEQAKAEVSNREDGERIGSPRLEGETARFGLRSLNRRGVSLSDIDGVKLAVKLASEDIEESPSILNIQVKPVSPITSCQEAMEEYDSFSGNRNVTLDALVDGEKTELQCDFETQDGGWTKFAWFDTGSGGKSLITNEDGVTNTVPLSTDVKLSDCDVDDNECASTPDFEPPSNIDYSNYEDVAGPSESEELNGQLLIKARKNGRTIDWAAVELDAYANHKDVENPVSGVSATKEEKETLATNETMDWVKNLNKDLQLARDTENTRSTEGGYEGETTYYPDDSKLSVGESAKVNNCLYPYAHADNYTNKNPRCLTHYQRTDKGGDSGGILKLSQVQKKKVSGGSSVYVDIYNYVSVTIVETDSGRKVDNLECLGKSKPTIDECELYYSTGSAINTTVEGSIVSDPTAVPDILDIPLKNHWSGNSTDVVYTDNRIEDIEGNADLGGADGITPASGLNGDSQKAVSFTSGISSMGTTIADNYAIDSDAFTVAGHMSVNSDGTVFSMAKPGNVGGSDGSPFSSCGGACQHNTITIKSKSDGTIDAEFKWVLEGTGEIAERLTAGSGLVNSGEMNHVAFTWNGRDADRTGVLYVNGQVADVADLSSEVSQSAIDDNGNPIDISRPASPIDGRVVLGGPKGTPATPTYSGRVDDWIVSSGYTASECQIKTLEESRIKANPVTKC